MAWAVSGSPPRMRGLPSWFKEGVKPTGITPAHAGLTFSLLLIMQCRPDHPRACGAYIVGRFGRLGRLGSPPRMRGLHDIKVPDEPMLGITPAHAGLTFVVACVAFWLRDHPRACGAYPIIIFHSSSLRGSPPRMRGLQIRHPRPPLFVGITPAHAGLTGRKPAKIPACWDHPRACGAY